jgi:hypothetical protein
MTAVLGQPVDEDRAARLLELAQELCATIIDPVPASARSVVLDVAIAAYTNPAGVESEAAGPVSGHLRAGPRRAVPDEAAAHHAAAHRRARRGVLDRPDTQHRLRLTAAVGPVPGFVRRSHHFLMFPYGEQVILHRRGAKTGQDGYGKDQYAPEASYPLNGCTFWPEGSVEIVQGRETVIDKDTVAVPREQLPPGITSILPTDELTARGVRRQISGKPLDYGPNPFTGRSVPITVRLEEVTG